MVTEEGGARYHTSHPDEAWRPWHHPLQLAHEPSVKLTLLAPERQNVSPLLTPNLSPP